MIFLLRDGKYFLFELWGMQSRTSDDWQPSEDVRSQGTGIGIEFVDIPLPKNQKNPIQFTFLWLDEDRWEGKDYIVNVREQEVAAQSGANSPRKRKLHLQGAIPG